MGKCEYWKAGESGYYHCHQPDWVGKKYGCFFFYAGQEVCPNYKQKKEVN